MVCVLLFSPNCFVCLPIGPHRFMLVTSALPFLSGNTKNRQQYVMFLYTYQNWVLYIPRTQHNPTQGYVEESCVVHFCNHSNARKCDFVLSRLVSSCLTLFCLVLSRVVSSLLILLPISEMGETRQDCEHETQVCEHENSYCNRGLLLTILFLSHNLILSSCVVSSCLLLLFLKTLAITSLLKLSCVMLY